MTKGNSLNAMCSLAEVSSKISEGEFMQLSSEQNVSIKVEEYIKIISLKTAELFDIIQLDIYNNCSSITRACDQLVTSSPCFAQDGCQL